MRAAEAYARGLPVAATPPSLRLYNLGRTLPGVITSLDVMAQDYELLRELECYADAENRARARAAARQRHASKHRR